RTLVGRGNLKELRGGAGVAGNAIHNSCPKLIGASGGKLEPCPKREPLSLHVFEGRVVGIEAHRGALGGPGLSFVPVGNDLNTRRAVTNAVEIAAAGKIARIDV